MKENEFKQVIKQLALNKSFVKEIELHDTEYYNTLEDSEFLWYEKIHSKGDPKYSGSWLPFYKGKELGVYNSDVWRHSDYFFSLNELTTDDIIEKIVDRLKRRYGEHNVVNAVKYGVVKINPHIALICQDGKEDRKIRYFTFENYQTAENAYNEAVASMDLYSTLFKCNISN